MDAQAALNKIYELDRAISQFNNIRNELGNYRIQTLARSGSGRWAGRQKKRYMQQLDEARLHLNQARNQVGQAISDCKSRQRSLASTIDPIEHPILSAQAWHAVIW